MSTTDILLTMLDEIPGWERVKLPELLAFQKHSVTSELAAESMAPKAGTLRAKVLEEIKRGPKTDEELIDALGMNPSTLRPVLWRWRRGDRLRSCRIRGGGD